MQVSAATRELLLRKAVVPHGAGWKGAVFGGDGTTRGRVREAGEGPANMPDGVAFDVPDKEPLAGGAASPGTCQEQGIGPAALSEQLFNSKGP